jgi:hypothetical protein
MLQDSIYHLSEIHLTFKFNLFIKYKYAYLCTFNNRDWQAIYWERIKGNKIVFKNMGRDIAYLPVLYKNSGYSPIGDPIILLKNGNIRICSANLDKR